MNAQPRILVVDDEPSMLRYMQTLLELDSFRVGSQKKHSV